MLDNSLPNMKIQSTTIYRLPITNYNRTFGISTFVENPLQISPFLTNKANFRKSQINVSEVLTKEYEKLDSWWGGKNKANTNPIQTQYKANSKPIQTQFKPKQTQFQGRKNADKNLIIETNWHFAGLKDLADLWALLLPFRLDVKIKRKPAIKIYKKNPNKFED